MYARLLSLSILLCSVWMFVGCEKVDQRRARRLANQAVDSIKSQQYSNAKSLLKKAVRLYAYDPNTYYLLGRTHQASEEYPEAVQAYLKCISLDSANKSAQFYLAKIYIKNKEPLKAIPHYEKAFELNAKDSNYAYELALAYQKARRFPKAAETMQKAIQLNGKFTAAYNGLASIHLDQAAEHEPPPPEPKPEEDDKKKKKKKGEKEPPRTILVPVAEAAKPFYQKAETALLSAIQNQASDEQTYNLLALLYIKQHQFEQAVRTTQKITSTKPNDAGALYHMGLAYDLWFEKVRVQALTEKDEAQKKTFEREATEKREKALDIFKDFIQRKIGTETMKMDVRMKIRSLTELKEKELAKQIEKERKRKRRRRRRR
ncbi:MAG: tetratricopeptide repeat protein [Myxococcales bacterium]|nr:tetratricopeptide repeat protein [Myxococcales bacterium]MCB9642895.1 tetratricopeptide repeat protein [Myxococcales bacterium]